MTRSVVTSEEYEILSAIAINRYRLIRIGFRWLVMVGDSDKPYFTSLFKKDAENVLFDLKREFLNGGYLALKIKNG